MAAKDQAFEKIIEVARIVSQCYCESRETTGGGPESECQKLYASEDDWCLTCMAKKAVADYEDAE